MILLKISTGTVDNQQFDKSKERERERERERKRKVLTDGKDRDDDARRGSVDYSAVPSYGVPFGLGPVEACLQHDPLAQLDMDTTVNTSFWRSRSKAM
jgi:hypothetical protein